MDFAGFKVSEVFEVCEVSEVLEVSGVQISEGSDF